MNEIQLLRDGWKLATTCIAARAAAHIRVIIGTAPHKTIRLPGGMVAVYVRK